MKQLLLVAAMLAALPALAEKVEWRGYTIYYTTFRSTLVPPDVAALHDITRDDDRILTNITVRRDGEPYRAKVSGTVSNLLNQMSELRFSEVIEEAAIYYLANQLVDERDTLRYRLSIKPEGEDDSLELEFTRRYFGGMAQ